MTVGPLLGLQPRPSNPDAIAPTGRPRPPVRGTSRPPVFGPRVNQDRGRWAPPIALIPQEFAACTAVRAGLVPKLAPGQSEFACALRTTIPMLPESPRVAAQCAASKILSQALDCSC